MIVMEDEQVAERVGQFDFVIESGEPCPESRRRWERRSDVLAAWLLAEWRRERKEACRG